MSRPHIVIVGAGFGGVYTAKYLLPYVQKKMIDVTLVSRTNYFLFTPLLHEVATGRLRPTSISESLREIFKNTGVKIYQSEIKSIDTKSQKITAENSNISYDYLVIATGAQTNYYGIPGALEYTFSLKNLIDAVNIREKIINSFEKSILTENEEEKKRLLSFVVVGGGATGVETVCEMAEMVNEIKNKYYKKIYNIPNVLVTLINTDKEILKPFHPKIRKIAEERLKGIGVNLLSNTKVSSLEAGKVNFSDGNFILAETIIWAAGVTPTIPKFLETEVEFLSGRIETNEYLEIKKIEKVFAIGDSANVQNGEKILPHPMLAQVATSQAKILAKNIISKIKAEKLTPFYYKSKGNLISLGQWYAAGEIGGIIISGKFAWWVWRTVYLFKFNSWLKRIRIASEWTIDIFFTRDITEII